MQQPSHAPAERTLGLVTGEILGLTSHQPERPKVMLHQSFPCCMAQAPRKSRHRRACALSVLSAVAEDGQAVGCCSGACFNLPFATGSLQSAPLHDQTKQRAPVQALHLLVDGPRRLCVLGGGSGNSEWRQCRAHDKRVRRVGFSIENQVILSLISISPAARTKRGWRLHVLPRRTRPSS